MFPRRRRRRGSNGSRARSRALPIMLLLALLGGGTAGTYVWHRNASPSAASETVTYRVSRVVDGDTLDVTESGRLFAKPLRVRLLCINTPERKQPGWAEAKQTLERLTTGRYLTLRFAEAGESSDDRYDRVLAYVFAAETNVNVELVRQGWSPYWTKYGRGRFPDSFEQAEREAKRERRGLWKSG